MLLYFLEQGDTERTILLQASRTGQQIPDRIANAPELLPGLELYYQGFHMLTSSRTITMGGPGTIPWHIKLLYCKEYGIEGEQREYFYEMLSSMDEVYLKHSAAKSSSSNTPIKKGKQ